ALQRAEEKVPAQRIAFATVLSIASRIQATAQTQRWFTLLSRRAQTLGNNCPIDSRTRPAVGAARTRGVPRTGGPRLTVAPRADRHRAGQHSSSLSGPRRCVMSGYLPPAIALAFTLSTGTALAGMPFGGDDTGLGPPSRDVLRRGHHRADRHSGRCVPHPVPPSGSRGDV